MKKRIVAILLCVAMSISLLATTAFAEDAEKPYLVLGADLNESQLTTVLDLLGVKNKDSYLDDYQVSYTKNQEERDQLGSYLDSSVIGSRALSSIKLTPMEKGSGIHITTHNINYCTVSMYQNALVTAGFEDVDLVVAGPFELSGTAALVSAAKAYQIMTGKKLNPDKVDAANNELVLTGDLGEVLGDPEKAVDVIAAVKKELFADESDFTDEDVNEAIDEVCKEMNITLDQQTRQEIIDLMNKLAATGFDVDKMKEQASEIFKDISGILGDAAQQNGGLSFFQRLIAAFKQFMAQF